MLSQDLVPLGHLDPGSPFSDALEKKRLATCPEVERVRHDLGQVCEFLGLDFPLCTV